MTETDRRDAVALRLLLALVVAVSLARYLHGVAKILAEASFIDFAHYYTFTYAVALGLNPLDPEAVARVDRLLGLRRAMSPADYPPLFYLLMRPWTWLPFRPAAVLWLLAGQACLAATVWLCLRRVAVRAPVRIAAALFVALNYQPITEELALGQADLPILLLVTLAWWSLRRGRDWSAALAIALALHVKVQYALLIPLLYWSGRRGAAARAVGLALLGGAASVLVLGPAYPVEYARFLLAFPEGFFSWIVNLSLRGTLHRLFGPSPIGWALAAWLTLAVDLALVVILARVIPRRTARDAPAADWVWALGLTAIPLLSPLTEEHHLVVLLLPLLLLCLTEPERAERPWELGVLVASIVLLASRYSLARFPAFHTGVLSLLATGKLLGVAGLAWVLARRLRASVGAGDPARERSTVPRLGVDGRELGDGVRTGIARYLLEVVRAAARDGWECVVYGDRETKPGLALPGVSLRVVPGRWTQWWDQVRLPRRLGRDEVSVFLSPYYKGPLAAPCPVVLTIHDLYFIGYPGRRRQVRDALVRWLARLYLRRAAAVITDSEYSRRAILERLGASAAKVTVIPVALGAEFRPAPLTEAARRRYGLRPPYVLYVGNFKPHKNLPALLRAYAALPPSLGEPHQLVLAGGDLSNRPRLEALARELGVADRVAFTGPVEDEDLPALYSGAALLALPSLEEGFGLPALEAMACGTPVVASARAAVPEVVGDAARLVDPEDEAALRAALVEVLSREELRAELRRRGLARAREFGAERTAGQVVALLRAVAGRAAT